MANAGFWDKAARKYAASPVKDMAAYEDTLARTRHYLQPDDHLLEVGCGTGSTALKLAGCVGQITATDISAEMIAIAQGKQSKAGVSNINFEQSEITQPHADVLYDAICAFSILHLVDDLDVALTHLRTQLKPGGYFISKTACLKEMNFLIPLAVRMMKVFGKAPDVLSFDAAGLEAAFRKAGYEVVETGYFGKNKYARFIVARRPTT